MTTLRIERQGRTNSRSWHSLGLRVLALAGFATAAWLLSSGSAAQADTGTQSDSRNIAPAVGKAPAHLGGLVSSVSAPTLAIASGVLEGRDEAEQPVSRTANQVVPILAKTTHAVLSVVTEGPAETGHASLISPLAAVISPVTDVLRPVTGSITEPSELGRAVAATLSRQVTAINHGTSTSVNAMSVSADSGGSKAAPGIG